MLSQTQFTGKNGYTPCYSVDGKTNPEEWEYAAKGGENYKYAGSDNLDEVAWNYRNSSTTTHKVATKKANGYGLYDMSGNVWEWCWNTWSKSSSSRVYRGGSCSSSYDSYCTVSNRDYYNHYYRDDNVGFRICRGL